MRNQQKPVMRGQSWNDIYDRAVEFASEWRGTTYEKGESQSFWIEFLDIFSINRRRHGALFEDPVTKNSGGTGFVDLFWPGKLLIEQKSGGKDLDKAQKQAYEYLLTLPDHDLPEAVVVCNFERFRFINQRTREKTEFDLEDLPKHVKLFAFFFGETSQKPAEQDPVNRRAAESMALLHNQLRDDNYIGRDLELLLVRLVFLMFAEDSGIFERGVLLDYIMSRTAEDGSDLGPRLVQVFGTLDTQSHERQTSSLDEAIASLPYVNGALFSESIRTPSFNREMRQDLIKAMKLDWSAVSPAIFGSMFQGVMDEEQRRKLGAHYTSEVNILKVIKPLFLDSLYNEFRSATRAGPRKKIDELRKLQDKISNLRFLDPACGCGNFLVITYRELRKLEHKIIDTLSKHTGKRDMLVGSSESPLKVNVDQMYGIEIEEFPSLVAQTALWLTDHQMNMEYSRQAAHAFKRIPLTASATIVNDNALTADWGAIINPRELDYILGNPPFSGSKMMTSTMRSELLEHFPDVKGAGVLDFVSAWYAKATSMMKQNRIIKSALVSTNSITQGEQVSILWPYLFNQGVSIDFAHQTFKWSNNAKGNAAVYCVIIGFSLESSVDRLIYEYADIKAGPIVVRAKHINAYLVDAPDIFIERRGKPISIVPQMTEGITALDKGGNLRMTQSERNELVQLEPKSQKWIKPWITGQSLLNNDKLYCLWLVDIAPNELRAMPKVLERVERVKNERLQSKYSSQFADRSHTFRETEIAKQYIVFPKTSSENRDYIPLAFVRDAITSNTCLIVPNATTYHFGVLTSRLHMVWMRTVAGRLKSDYRYSKDIVYNNFVWPDASDTQRDEIENLAQAILDARSEHQKATLADLYDSIAMPTNLRKAHNNLDKAVDKLYGLPTGSIDTQRVACLFELYQEYPV